ncbi:MAG: iron-sulfur cluster-binding domain-containing protein [Rhodovibrionaceae bacterium]
MNFLGPFIERGDVVLHHDEGDPSKGLDIPKLLSSYESGTHLYYCGPAGFMKAAKQGSAHWPKEAVHFEHFATALDPERAAVPPGGFEVKIASSGDTFHVPPDKTIVAVLREHGVEVETSCEDGVCGTCMTRFLEGEVEHRDLVLDEEEQQEYMMICCSRVKSPLLILDL